MNDTTLPTSITEAISAIRCDARFGDTIRGLESTLAPWLAIVREVAEMDPCVPGRDCCTFCDRDGVLMDGIDAGGAWHLETCPWLRATQLVAASHRT